MRPARKTKLWVNKEMRSDSFEPMLLLDFFYLCCYLSVSLMIGSS